MARASILPGRGGAAWPLAVPSPVGRAWHRGRLWAVTRSPSLVGLLYLPVPEDPVVSPRVRLAPTAGRLGAVDGLLAGATHRAGQRLGLAPPLAWSGDAAALQDGEEVLALVRLGRLPGQGHALRLARELVSDWIAANPPAAMPGWEPGVLARRLACWCTALAEAGGDWPAAELKAWRQSLWLQARFLASNLERHEGGPRLLAGLRALLAAGHLLSGAEPRRWTRLATALLGREVERQVLPDGGHSSRSPATHLCVLADLIDCLHLLAPESPASRAIRGRLPALSHFAHHLAHAAGAPAGFGLHGPAPSLGPLAAAASLSPPGRSAAAAFPDSGFWASHPDDGAQALLVDWRGSPLGAAAAGSYEWSLGGKPFVHQPAPGAAHNSAEADGQPFPGTGGDPRLRALVWGEGPGFAYLAIELSGGGRSLARRLLHLDGRAMVAIDRVGGAERLALTRIQLPPGSTIEAAGPRRLFLSHDGRTCTLAWMPGARLETAEGAVRAASGATEAATQLVLSAPGGGPRLLGYLLAAGRRRDAELDVVERSRSDDERVAVRFDPRRYLFRWAGSARPELLFAD